MDTIKIISMCLLNIGAISVSMIFTIITIIEFLKRKKQDSTKMTKRILLTAIIGYWTLTLIILSIANTLMVLNI